VTQAQSVTDYQAVGVRCREALLELIGVTQDAAATFSLPINSELQAIRRLCVIQRTTPSLNEG
jgi:hypothetical protein